MPGRLGALLICLTSLTLSIWYLLSERIMAEMKEGGSWLYSHVVNGFLIVGVFYYTAILFAITEPPQANYNHHNVNGGQARVPQQQ